MRHIFVLEDRRNHIGGQARSQAIWHCHERGRAPAQVAGAREGVGLPLPVTHQSTRAYALTELGCCATELTYRTHREKEMGQR
jgi:hypothetical protein